MTIFSVAQINAYIHGKFECDEKLRMISVKGELSNVKYHPSGHIYFTLKDARSAIAGVMFASNASMLQFQMKEGQAVVVTGSISVFERDGRYQIYASQIILDGAGILFERYEKLKQELLEMGMFDQAYKQSIPAYIQTLGVVTAGTGAAVRDIIQIAQRRFPYIQIILYPAKVQGEGAAVSIVNGIHALEQYGVDTMIVGRGGGSIEDLWAFNEEIVARAIFECPIPVISAVGHETDTTIADWVADLRAPTPSAAAELAVYDYGDYVGRCLDDRSMLNHLIRQKLSLYRSTVERLKLRTEALSPEARVREQKMTMLHLSEQLDAAIKKKLLQKKHQTELYIEELKGLSPLLKLSQGYSVVENQQGQVITDIQEVRGGELLTVHLKNGHILTEVKETKKGIDYGDKED